jgi:phage terminase large subunit
MCEMYPGTGWLLGRKELLNLKRTTLLTLFKVWEEYGFKAGIHYTYNQQSNIINWHNGSQIFLFDLGYQPSDPLYTRLGGLELTGAAVDESNEVPV